MTEKILEKFDALEEKERILEAIRENNTDRHHRQRKKPLITPLLFDLHVQFGDTITPSASKIIKNKPHDLKNPKRSVSFKYKPNNSRSDLEESDLRPPILGTMINYEESKLMDHKEENLKSRPISLRYLKDKDELWSKHLCKKSAESSVPTPKLTNESNASKKENVSPPFTDQHESRTKKSMHSTDHSADSSTSRGKCPPKGITKESELTRNDEARKPHPVKQSIMLPLDCEDLLKNPKIKTIDLRPAVTVHTSMKQSHANPIIFYDTEYVQMLFLTKRFTPYAMKCTERNIVLEKNYEVLKVLFSDEPSAVSEPIQQKHLQVFSAEYAQKSINEKRKKKHDRLVSKKISPNTRYNLSQTFSSLSKKFVGYFDKDVTQGKSYKANRFERFSKTKPPPTRKLTTLPIKYDSKPLKNIFEIHKLNNMTPLDNLLGLRA
ncbi:uncharacterized protein C1orf141 homolog isoform X1 [Mus musculus]|uniref:uncharacterized protein C1orf141 homolog isoform X1 n=1 Tax=Mus musculus TaxID=10090 RepID=UPI0003D73CED|nr:uncharacterized protein C1orf141 homolog isoform X1 [Mus musculus]|eukprot:XP_006503458.1 PREDICTED: uncharacterized protein C1orf141 homolog isoform X1 [Mus musculus]